MKGTSQCGRSRSLIFFKHRQFWAFGGKKSESKNCQFRVLEKEIRIKEPPVLGTWKKPGSKDGPLVQFFRLPVPQLTVLSFDSSKLYQTRQFWVEATLVLDFRYFKIIKIAFKLLFFRSVYGDHIVMGCHWALFAHEIPIKHDLGFDTQLIVLICKDPPFIGGIVRTSFEQVLKVQLMKVGWMDQAEGVDGIKYEVTHNLINQFRHVIHIYKFLGKYEFYLW